MHRIIEKMPVRSTIRIMTFNGRSIRSMENRAELCLFLINNNIDLGLVQETFLKENDKYYIPGYTVIRMDRDGIGGGLLILVRHGIKFTTIDEKQLAAFEHMTIKLNTINGGMYVTNIYISKYSRGLTAGLKSLLTRENHIILGDWNANHSSWSRTADNQIGKKLFELIPFNNYFIYAPDEPTYNHSNGTRSTIDFIVSNTEAVPCNIFANVDLQSDHIAVQCDMQCLYDELPKKMVYNYSKANWKLFEDHMNNELRETEYELNSIENIDASIESFSELIRLGHEMAVPKIEIEPKKLISQCTINLIKQKNDLNRQLIREPNIQRKRLLKSLLNRMRQLISENAKMDRQDSWDEHISKCNGSVKKFWRLAKQLRTERKMSGFRINGVHITNEHTIANVIGGKFAQAHLAFNRPQNEADIHIKDTVEEFLENEIDEEINPFEIDELNLIISNLKKKKAPGIDQINNNCIKMLPQLARQKFLDICNACQLLNYWPKAYKIASIIPIPKAGVTPSINAFRPISLLPSLSKVMERLIATRLDEYIERENLLPNHQMGFRCSLSATHQAAKLAATIDLNKSRHTSTGMISLDIAKAFDSIWYDGLSYKMIQRKFPTRLIKWIDNYCRGRTFTVKYEQAISNSFDIPNGLPQGSVLAPKLYILFTADIPSTPKTQMLTFADDTIILTNSAQHRAIISRLTFAYTKVSRYFNKWHIRINTDKTKHLIIPFDRKRRRITNKQLILEGNALPLVDCLKYLGINFDRSGKFKNHIQHVKNRIVNTSRSLYPMIKNYHLDDHRRNLLVKMILSPTAFYGMPVWAGISAANAKSIRQKFSRAARSLCKLDWSFSTDELYEKLNMINIEVAIKESRGKFQDKLGISLHPLLAELGQFLAEVWD